MPLMKSLRDLRLSNTSGYCVLVEANVEVNIPTPLINDARNAGMVEVSEQPVAPEPVQEPDPEPEVDHEKRAAQLDKAILKVLTRADEADFKKDGTPKATKIVAELPPEFFPRPSATEIFDAYEKLQDNFDLAEE